MAVRADSIVSSISSNTFADFYDCKQSCLQKARQLQAEKGFSHTESLTTSLYKDVEKLLSLEILPNDSSSELECIFYYILSHIGDGLETNDQLKFTQFTLKLIQLYVEKVIPKYANVPQSTTDAGNTKDQNNVVFGCWLPVFKLIHNLLNYQMPYKEKTITTSLPLIVCNKLKQDSSYPKLYPKVFQFCTSLGLPHEETRSVQLNLNDPKDSDLKYGTTSTALLQFLRSHRERGKWGRKSFLIEGNVKTPFRFGTVSKGNPDIAQNGLVECNLGSSLQEILVDESACQIIFSIHNVINCTNEQRVRYQFYNRGTRAISASQFRHQLVACDRTNPISGEIDDSFKGVFVVNEVEKTVDKLEVIENIGGFQIPVRFCASGCSTHPQVIFLGNLQIGSDEAEALIDNIPVLRKITFSNSHACSATIIKKCFDCEHYRKGVVMYKSLHGSLEGGPSKKEKISVEGESSVARFSLKMFAILCSPVDRVNIEELQSNYRFFQEADFEVIKTYWKEFPGVYVIAE